MTIHPRYQELTDEELLTEYTRAVLEFAERPTVFEKAVRLREEVLRRLAEVRL